MPEGHTLLRLARSLDTAFAGDTVRASSPQGRFVESAALVDGSVLERAHSWGKHLFLELGAERTIHVHLGLYGKMSVRRIPSAGVPAPVGQVRLRLLGRGSYADLRGATACELLDEAGVAAVTDRLGPDPLRDDADPERLWRAVSRSRRPVAALLMDQSVIAGVGNVYRAELLFRAGLDPTVPGRSLSRRTVRALWDDAVFLMPHGVRTGRIDTLWPADDPDGIVDGSTGDDVCARGVYVYRRNGEPCRRCGTTVRTAVLEARNLFWCPRCQRRRSARPHPVPGVPAVRPPAVP